MHRSIFIFPDNHHLNNLCFFRCISSLNSSMKNKRDEKSQMQIAMAAKRAKVVSLNFPSNKESSLIQKNDRTVSGKRSKEVMNDRDCALQP